LENTCRWLTVMASGREIHLDDLPQELREMDSSASAANWQTSLATWVNNEFLAGTDMLLERVVPIFEKIMIEAAMNKAGGKRLEAAKLLGWGRNTLTRKIKELGLYCDEERG
jgi:two-component system, NtrC family, nitrogen regulation response regulator GlnG